MLERVLTFELSKQDSPFAICFENVTTRIGRRTILDCVTLTIKQGEIAGVLGPNGAGKTTLLSTIMGLRAHAAGQVTVLGQTPSSRNTALLQRIGVVFQETALYDELTTVENLKFAASLFGVRNTAQRISE